MPHQPLDIIALGEPLFEFSFEEEGVLPSGRCLSGFGGDVSNFAVAAARAGGSVGICTRLGVDPFGEAFLAMWRSEGVDASLVERDPGAPTGLYFISRNAGVHTFTYYRSGTAASRMSPSRVPVDAIRRARLLHFSGVTQGISASSLDAAYAALDAARMAGVRVSYDPNYRPLFWTVERAREVIHETASRVDFLFPSLDEARLLTGLDQPERIVDFYRGLGAGTVALKLGKDGVLLATDAGVRHIPSLPVQAVDASGAGDIFAGAFAASWTSGQGLEECARFATVMAGLSTTKLGCVSSIPRLEEAQSRLAAWA
jgi:2-dehydro-3-deoxygluconokinase